MIRKRYTDRESWLEARKEAIGASDVAAILGLSPWTTVDKLYNEKTGIVPPDDLKGNKKVQFGIEAEQHIRELVALDFPQYKVIHHPFDILHHDAYPFITATLDGELFDFDCPVPEGSYDFDSLDLMPAIMLPYMGVLEIKTGSFRNIDDLREWEDGKIPMHYFCQVVQQLLVTRYSWALLVARLKRDPFKNSDEGLPEVRWYYRKIWADGFNVIQSKKTVLEADIEFNKRVQSNKRPKTIISIKGDSSWNNSRW